MAYKNVYGERKPAQSQRSFCSYIDLQNATAEAAFIDIANESLSKRRRQ